MPKIFENVTFSAIEARNQKYTGNKIGYTIDLRNAFINLACGAKHLKDRISNQKIVYFFVSCSNDGFMNAEFKTIIPKLFHEALPWDHICAYVTTGTLRDFSKSHELPHKMLRIQWAKSCVPRPLCFVAWMASLKGCTIARKHEWFENRSAVVYLLSQSSQSDTNAHGCQWFSWHICKILQLLFGIEFIKKRSVQNRKFTLNWLHLTF